MLLCAVNSLILDLPLSMVMLVSAMLVLMMILVTPGCICSNTARWSSQGSGEWSGIRRQLRPPNTGCCCRCFKSLKIWDHPGRKTRTAPGMSRVLIESNSEETRSNGTSISPIAAIKLATLREYVSPRVVLRFFSSSSITSLSSSSSRPTLFFLCTGSGRKFAILMQSCRRYSCTRKTRPGTSTTG